MNIVKLPELLQDLVRESPCSLLRKPRKLLCGCGEMDIWHCCDLSDLDKDDQYLMDEREVGRTINTHRESAMMQALGALCVAALGGLTIATYRHPKEYQKPYLVLIIIILVSMWTMVAFNIGNYWAQSAIWGSGVFEYDNASKATDAISNAEIPDWIMGVLPAALIAYIVFLSSFQYLLTNDRPLKDCQQSPSSPSR